MSIILDGSTGITTPNIISPTQTISTKLDLTGGQIKFPATQVPSSDANTLDDYEEGTWTPIFAGSTIAGTQTYSAQDGKYIKVGKLVNIFFRLTMTAKDASTSGYARILGLPFTVNAYTALDISFVYGLTMATGYTVNVSSLSVGTGFQLISLSDGSWNDVPVSNIAGSFDIMGSAKYMTAN